MPTASGSGPGPRPPHCAAWNVGHGLGGCCRQSPRPVSPALGGPSVTLMLEPGAFGAARPTGPIGGRSAGRGCRRLADRTRWSTRLQRRAAIDPARVLYTYLEDGETLERSFDGSRSRRGGACHRPNGSRSSPRPEPGSSSCSTDGLDTIKGLFGCLAAGLVARCRASTRPRPRSTERLLGILRDSQATRRPGPGSRPGRVSARARRGPRRFSICAGSRSKRSSRGRRTAGPGHLAANGGVGAHPIYLGLHPRSARRDADPPQPSCTTCKARSTPSATRSATRG